MSNGKIEKIWRRVYGNKTDVIDFAGRKIQKNNKQFWNIDHTIPKCLKKKFGKALIESDENKMPIHIQTNREKGNDLLFKTNNKFFEVDVKNIKINEITEKEYEEKKGKYMSKTKKTKTKDLKSLYTYKKGNKTYDIADYEIDLNLEIKEWQQNNSLSDEQPVSFKFVRKVEIISSNKFANEWKIHKEKNQPLKINDKFSILISNHKNKLNQIIRRYHFENVKKDVYIDGEKKLEKIIESINFLNEKNKEELKSNKELNINQNQNLKIELLQNSFEYNKLFFTLELNKKQLLENKENNIIEEIITKIKEINPNFSFHIENSFTIKNSLFLSFEINEINKIIKNLEINNLENNFYFWDYKFTLNENYNINFNKFEDIFKSIFKINNIEIRSEYWNNLQIKRKRINNEQSNND